MAKKILIVAVGLLALLIAVVATRPDEFKIMRASSTINAPATVVFDQINNFRNWETWSPWAKLDPNMEVRHEGAESGKGAVYTWSGNNDAGEGRMEILESIPGSKIVIDLEFLKPFPAKNETLFTFTPDGDGTVVTWVMSGKNNFVSKLFGLVMNMDELVGKDFEKGLLSLKEVSETKHAVTN